MRSAASPSASSGVCLYLNGSKAPGAGAAPPLADLDAAAATGAFLAVGGALAAGGFLAYSKPVQYSFKRDQGHEITYSRFGSRFGSRLLWGIILRFHTLRRLFLRRRRLLGRRRFGGWRSRFRGTSRSRLGFDSRFFICLLYLGLPHVCQSLHQGIQRSFTNHFHQSAQANSCFITSTGKPIL